VCSSDLHWLGEEERTLAVVKFPIFDIAGDAVGVGGVDIDITDRKRMEKEALAARDSAAEARALLTDAIENISEGFVLYDSDERLLLCNSKFRDFYNYGEADVAPGTKYEDLVRLDFERGVIADQDGQWENYIDRRIAYGKEEKGSFEVKLADGRWILIHERSTSVGGRVGVQADITELKRAEEALRESEALLNDAIDCVSEGFALYDADDRLMLCNKTYRDLWGYSDTEAAPGVHWDDLDRLDVERGTVIDQGSRMAGSPWRTALSRRRQKQSVEIQFADGRWVTIRDRETAAGGSVSIQADITELKRAEEMLREAKRRSEEDRKSVV
jgi:PAS domain S-box-containing protein